ncbi:MAG: TVP38/TMEM64 family protein [Deltaproteobacteria bacterium]|nr:TVP38/TMEM64 family protein [Deltaproteobacteria bacterium]
MVARLLVLAAVVALVGAAWWGGAFDRLDAERVRALLAESGAWGPVLYVASFALLEPLGAPGILFILPASFVWPLGAAFALSWIASVCAGIVGFGFARWIARDFVQRHLPERFHRFDRQLAERALRTVIIVRLVFFLAPPAHWVLGVSRVPFGTFVLGSAIGFAPGVALMTVAGPAVVEFWNSVERPGLWIALAVLIFAVGRRVVRRFRSGRTVE